MTDTNPNSVQPTQFVTTENGDTAFVVRIDEKSQRAVVYFVDEDSQGYATMRALKTLTPVKAGNGRIRKVKNVKAAVAACKTRTFVA